MKSTRYLLLSVLASASFIVAAQEAYPNKAVRIVVPIGAGGVADSGARIVARRLSEELGQPVIVENRPGANQVIGTALVATAPADGYTLLWTTGGIAAVSVLAKSVPFDAFRDFAPVTLGGRSNLAVIGSASMPGNTLASFLSHARQNPGKLNYGTTTGSVTLIFEHLKQLADLDITAVPYKSTPNVWTDLFGGQIQVMLEAPTAAKAQVAGGRAKILAVTGGSRSADLPDVPTLSEQGLKDFNVYTWQGMFVRAGTPPDRLARIRNAMVNVMGNADVRAQFVKIGVEPVGSTPAELSDLMRSDLQLWRSVAKKANIQPE